MAVAGRRKDSVNEQDVARIMAMADAGASSREIVARLTELQVPTARGGAWYSSTVAAIIRRERAKVSGP
jgi:hypothetical protein